MRISGIVLAGGRSRRMGRDKAVLSYRGQRLVDRSVAALAEVCEDVVVASGRRRLPDVAVRQVPDAPAGTGPVGGLAGGLAAVNGELAMVLAVDLPTPDVQFLSRLAELWQGEAAVVPTARGHAQPLHAVWSVASAPPVAMRANAGVRSVIEVAHSLDALVLDEAQTAALVDHDRWAWNVNSPSDLDAGGT